MTNRDKAFALWFQEIRHRYHGGSDNDELGDPVKVFNVHGHKQSLLHRLAFTGREPSTRPGNWQCSRSCPNIKSPARQQHPRHVPEPRLKHFFESLVGDKIVRERTILGAHFLRGPVGLLRVRIPPSPLAARSFLQPTPH
jgi:hypothetical protein